VTHVADQRAGAPRPNVVGHGHRVERDAAVAPRAASSRTRRFLVEVAARLAWSARENGGKVRATHRANAMTQELVLETRGLTKEFRGFFSVRAVNLRIAKGSIHALIGPNGAGKTTCFSLLSKFLRPSAGTIWYRGVDITHRRPADVARDGLVRSFQISSVFSNLAARDNVRLALQRARGRSFDFWRSSRVLAALDPKADELLEAVGLGGLGGVRAAELSYGRKRALELATTLALEPDTLLLDEPMAGLGQEDIGRITALIRKIAAGRTVVMVEHNLGVVAELCDRITVLARGEILAEGDYATVSADAQVAAAYLGAAHG
jgi:branched-chain amino acid transport system ATP-binding protein